MIDIRQSNRYSKYLKTTGWQIFNLSGTKVFIKRGPLIGLIAKVQRPEELRLNKIEKLVKKERVLQIVIEPKRNLDANFLKTSGYKKSKSPYLPTKTLVVDLTKTKIELIGQMKKDARGAIRKTKDLKVANSESLATFRRAWKKAVGIKRYVPPVKKLKNLKKVFGKDVLFLISENKTAGAIILKNEKIAYYWQAFSSPRGREELAQYKIVWEAMVWAKERGAKIFDFEGIYDERYPNKTWKGFSHFKKSFGGEEVSYPGTFTKKIISFKLRE